MKLEPFIVLEMACRKAGLQADSATDCQRVRHFARFDRRSVTSLFLPVGFACVSLVYNCIHKR
eukprot:scaffold218093_cov25-Prasinocladus_malaysianus.AAC.2